MSEPVTTDTATTAKSGVDVARFASRSALVSSSRSAPRSSSSVFAVMASGEEPARSADHRLAGGNVGFDVSRSTAH